MTWRGWQSRLFRPLALKSEEPSHFPGWGERGQAGSGAPHPPVPYSPCALASGFRGRSGSEPSGQGLPPPSPPPVLLLRPQRSLSALLAERRGGRLPPENLGF